MAPQRYRYLLRRHRILSYSLEFYSENINQICFSIDELSKYRNKNLWIYTSEIELLELENKKWIKEKNELLNKAIERKDESEINRITKVIKRQELNYTENMKKYYFPQSCK